ncbi:hypothetical protein C2869_12845 [Saccharobesus litoralis]|uniref:Beta-lactamase-inhibitor-like PepSY-like domain-containing protein n=1 Tax=Saccharobesus litoralis TaxID=2172099 RepID=A0A2S0VSV8_9ALTE|nr:hypothetical protein [Saccharobesus litoralis]AWB67273.1 hypothetical protein C2869_12845 [Saccharobesus litoralis]
MLKVKLLSKTLVCTLSLLYMSSSIAGDNTIGSTLNKKVDLTLAEIPASILSSIAKSHPGFTAKQAEKEFKHGKTYIDIEGLDAKGNEIEFDLLQVGEQWQIVEIQRDLSIEQCPAQVLTRLKAAHPTIAPKRIIESDQGDGVIIYEFYTVDTQGKEAKYEVKLANGTAQLLTQEWQH